MAFFHKLTFFIQYALSKKAIFFKKYSTGSNLIYFSKLIIFKGCASASSGTSLIKLKAKCRSTAQKWYI